MCRSGRVQSGLCLPSRARVQLSNNGSGPRRVRVVHLRHFSGLHGFGSHFQIKYGSGSVPCSIFTGLIGFGYEFLDPWRPLMRTNISISFGFSWQTNERRSDSLLEIFFYQKSTCRFLHGPDIPAFTGQDPTTFTGA